MKTLELPAARANDSVFGLASLEESCSHDGTAPEARKRAQQKSGVFGLTYDQVDDFDYPEAPPFERHGVVYLMFAAALVVSALVASGLEWHSSASLHTVLEVIATLLALVVGLIALVRYKSKRTMSVLFVGIAFLGAGALDGYHALVTSELLTGHLPSAISSLLPWSWMASRMFLSLFLLLGWLAWHQETRSGNWRPGVDLYLYVAAGTAVVASFAFFSLASLPEAYFPALALARPQELVAGCLFLVAFVGYLRAQVWRTSPFEHYLMLSLLVDAASQILFMSRSVELFDAMFDLAHGLKIGSYLLMFVGVTTSMYDLFKSAEQGVLKLEAAHLSLQRRMRETEIKDLQLRELNDTLEERIAARTSELRESQTEALAIMEEAQRARDKAEMAERELASRAKELARSNAELEQFAYVAAHDLQEPLRMVASYTQLLRRRYEGHLDADADQFIQYAVEGAERMQALIKDLLAYSRVRTRGKEFTPTESRAALDRALANLWGMVRESGAEITVDGTMPQVSADPTQLSQLFQNLLSNAIKFHHPDRVPKIRVRAQRHDGEWTFSVRDNGIGIEKQYADRVFIIFQRLHGKYRYPGTGIGLSICKRIVERHGGRIWVESGADKGSTFFFTLPLERVESGSRERQSTAERADA